MRVQIQYNELRPLIKEGYEKVYDAMSRLLAPEEMIFAKWEAGFGGILQWTLPNDYVWRNFTQGDVYDKQAVIDEFMRLKEIGEKKLGTNERLKQAVYSIPSEASVYYAVTPDGKYHVMLTAWGYSFPNKPPVNDITWFLPPGAQDTTIRFIEEGQPMVNLAFDIHRNGVVLHHQTDEKGEKYFGKLTPGSELYIEVPSMSRRLTLSVVAGQTVYTFDLTTAKPAVPPVIPVTPVEEPPQPPTEDEPEEMICGDRTIKVQFIGSDGKPIAGRTVTLTQGGLMLTETATDDNGCIFLYGNDFANGVPVRTQIADAPGLPRYCEADFTIDLDENDYALIYYERRKKIAWWMILIFIVGILLAAINIWGAVETDIN
ncbi:MAG: hypothetical protein K2L55_02615 [Muribaculaceae bacterium]|nr:hypothetical protein [Muribaculaceae bacterium]